MAILLVDSREQAPLPLKPDTIFTEIRKMKLEVGDYCCEYTDGSRSPIVFERKALGDLFGTMTHGYQRFKREMVTAKQLGVQLVLLIEASLTDVYGGYSHSQMAGESCVQKLWTLWIKHGLQPVFCQDRWEAAAFVKETFEAYGRVYLAPKMGTK